MATETAKAKGTRGRKPKAELQQEFESIMKACADEKAEANAKVDGLLRVREDEIRESVKDLSAEQVIQKFATLNIELSKALSLISEKMVHELNLLNNMRQSVILEAKELERLHKIDTAQTALDHLIEEYSAKKYELENEIETMHSQWELDKQNQEYEEQEFQENLIKSRKKEQEEYEYKRNLERKKALDKYEEEIRLRDRQNREKQESLEKSWQMRETVLTERTEELAMLRKSVEEFPARLQRESDKSVADAIARTEQRLSQELAFLKHDREAEQRVAELKIKTLQETLEQQKQQNVALQKLVEEAKKQVQDIAIKAIEGASGAKALSHINQIAMEQAKGRPLGG